MLVGARLVAKAGVAEHQIVIRLQVFGIDGQSLLKCLHSVGIAFLQEIDAAKFVDDHAVAGILREHNLQARCCVVVFPFFPKDSRVKEIRASQLRRDSQGFFEDFARSSCIALLNAGPADIRPTVGILRVDLCDFAKRRFSAFQVALKK